MIKKKFLLSVGVKGLSFSLTLIWEDGKESINLPNLVIIRTSSPKTASADGSKWQASGASNWKAPIFSNDCCCIFVLGCAAKNEFGILYFSFDISKSFLVAIAEIHDSPIDSIACKSYSFEAEQP